MQILIATLIFFAAVYSEACNTLIPSRRKILITFAGDTGLEKDMIDDANKTIVETLGTKVQKHFMLLGGKYGGEHEKKSEVIIPAWRPNPVPQNTQIMKSGRDELFDVVKKINEDFESAKKTSSDFKNEDYEVIFVIGNHGVREIGKDGSQYGVAVEPTKPGSLDPPYLTEMDMTEFARALPPGIKVKTIFGQCFSSNVSEPFHQALKSKTSCHCGSNNGWFDQVAKSSALDRKMWEASQAESLSRGQSLSSATWIYLSAGVGAPYAASITRSDSLAYRFLIKKFNLNPQILPFELLYNRAEITLDRAKKANSIFTSEDKEFLAQYRLEMGRAAQILFPKLKKENVERLIDLILLAEPKGNDMSSIDERNRRHKAREELVGEPITDRVYRGGEEEKLRREMISRDESLVKLRARYELMEAFLLSADSKTRDEVIQSFACDSSTIFLSLTSFNNKQSQPAVR